MKKILVLMTVLFSFSALADITCKLESLNEFHEPVKTLYTETQKPGQMTASGTWDF